jgi:hypothetical protein
VELVEPRVKEEPDEQADADADAAFRAEAARLLSTV